eukprot:3845262-Alexandrium_andersonii.AAC.1
MAEAFSVVLQALSNESLERMRDNISRTGRVACVTGPLLLGAALGLLVRAGGDKSLASCQWASFALASS